MYTELLIAGYGGQGSLMMGEILAMAHTKNGGNATWQPTYTTAKRGGEANCSVILADEEILCPEIDNPEILVCFNQASYDKYAPTAVKGGIVLVNSDEAPECKIPDGVHVYQIPATQLANEAGTDKAINIVMMGALLKLRPMITMDEVAATLTEIWGEKRAEKLLPVNLKALELGQKAI